MRTPLICALAALALASGCDDPSGEADAGREPTHDAGPTDAGSIEMDAAADAGAQDASTDAATPPEDAATRDAASGDASTELCADRTGGAFITFAIADETLRVWSTNDAFIDEALTNLSSGDRRTPVFGKILAGVDCEPEHAWHLDPDEMSFADFTIEVCDGRPSDLDMDLDYWMNTVMSYCPWGPEITAVDDRR